MSKRSLGDAACEAGASKRQKAIPWPPSEKLALLRDYYKELRDFVKAAEGGESLEDSSALNRLVDLNKTTLPILRSFESKESTSSTPSTSIPAREANTKLPASLIPSLENMTAWTAEDIPSKYPPLPPIPDTQLEQMALTHRGKNEFTNYETLEFLGDSFIYHAASEIITQTFPELTPGRKSQIREGLLRNSNLAKYTLYYGIEQRANFPPEFTDGTNTGGTKVAAKERQKVHGDLFEAYVGALIRAKPPPGQGPPNYDGVAVALKWLKTLWAMSISKDIERKYGVRHNKQQSTPSTTSQLQFALPMQTIITNAMGAPSSTTAVTTTAPPAENSNQAAPTDSTPVSPSAPKEATEDKAVANPQRTLTFKVQLAALIGCKEVKIRYEDAPTKKVLRDKHSKMPLFTVAVWVDAWGTSECLGYGSALSKKAAGDKAAERALENKTKMKFYVAQKAKLYGDKDTPAATATQDETAK
ncbi:hypothetical protein SEUCBS139899_000363 [Sporothrix eucalyptigena]|uniref:RNase III domain-containing protein n=1 Tax=Sporothrix eucalyptigena TaxID=1812306 RepID=A0ABP0BDC4_9PEZI